MKNNPKNRMVNILVLTVSFIICFFIGELFIHLFLPIEYIDVQPHPEFGHVYLKNLNRIKHFKGYTSRLITDSKGFRSKEYDYKKPDKTKRVLVLGDSITANIAAPPETMYTQLLSDYLNKEFDENYQVLNRGIEGWGTDNEYIYFIRNGLKYNPDIVILQFTMGNDIIDVGTKDMLIFENDQIKINPKSKNISLFRHAKLLLNQHSGFYRLFALTKNRFLPPKNLYHGFRTDGLNKEFFSQFKKTTEIIKQLSRLCKERHIKFMVTVTADDLEVNPQHYKYWKNIHDYVSRNEFRQIRLLLIGFLKKNNIFFLDTSNTINQMSDYVSFEDGHYNIQGSKKFAALIFSYLKQNIFDN